MDQNINPKNKRGETTRQHILTVAAALFSKSGYEAISIELLLQACGMSRGALYHHFSSKEALFTAVLEAAETRIAATITRAAQGAANPLDALRIGCSVWLQMARDPVARRIVLIDAPSVIGWQAWREMDARHGLGLLKASFGMAAAAGSIHEDKVDLYAHILLATLIEVALLIARAEDDARIFQAGQEAVEQILSGLFGVEPNGSQ